MGHDQLVGSETKELENDFLWIKKKKRNVNGALTIECVKFQAEEIFQLNLFMDRQQSNLLIETFF